MIEENSLFEIHDPKNPQEASQKLRIINRSVREFRNADSCHSCEDTPAVFPDLIIAPAAFPKAHPARGVSLELFVSRPGTGIAQS
jgi:hypothetical protein